MKAIFPGNCQVCGIAFMRGEEIEDSGQRGPRGGKRMAHARCVARHNPIPGHGGMAIPGDYPDSDYVWGPDPEMANWTSYPEYSYEQFYRTNPSAAQEFAFMGASRSLQPRREVGADDIYLGSDKVGYVERVPWGGGSYRLDVYLVDPESDFSIQHMVTVKPEQYNEFMHAWWRVYGSRVLSQGFGGQAIGRANPRRRRSHRVTRNPSAAQARPVYMKMPQNAGPYLPEMYPYGYGGKPAEYTTAPKKAKKNSASARYVVVKADGTPCQAQVYTGPGRSFWGDDEFTTQSAASVGEIIEMIGPHGVIELYEVIVAAGPMSTTRKADRGHVRRVYKMAKKNRGPRGGYSAAERDALPPEAFLKPSTRKWPVSDRQHAEYAIQYMARGFGNRSEYPSLIRRLADHYSPEDAKNRSIWTFYRQQRAGIQSISGVPMPTVRELRRAAANPRRRRK